MIRRCTNPAPLVACLLLALLPLSASAEISGAARLTEQTPPLNIALVFYKLIGEKPPFRLWVEKTAEYQKLAPVDRDAFMEKKVQELGKTFGLISPFETITLNTVGMLSPYDPSVPGISILTFKEKKIFPIEYIDGHYGIIPQNLDQISRLKMTKEAAEALLNLTQQGSMAKIELQLTPSSVLDEDPTVYNGVKYWPLKTTVTSLSVWSADGKRKLWETSADDSLKSKIKRFFYQGWL